MAEKTAVVDKIQAIAERVAASEGLEIVDVQLLGGGAHRMLRLYIDKPEGVSHADCELVSQQVGTILDVEDIIPGGRYTLEVSSPGVERKLSRPRDFERFTGQRSRSRCGSLSRISAIGPGYWPASPKESLLLNLRPAKLFSFRWSRWKRPTSSLSGNPLRLS